MSVLQSIIFITALAGTVSVLIAASCSLSLLSKMVENMVSVSVGILLSTALLHSLPEAFSFPGSEPRLLFATLLAGLLGFFLLEKISLLRHSHHHEGDGHDHHHGHDAEVAGRSGWMILVGDGLHNFVDGVLIAAAFMADYHVGFFTALAIIAHEIPQEIGDFMVLLNAGFTRSRALLYNLICGLAAVLGGVLAYFFLAQAHSIMPYLLVIASSSFIYIAVSDLIPQMHRRPHWAESLRQTVLIACGVGFVLLLSVLH
ncbi:ZIP family metal transporter [Polynucleobacter sphagniphilus]|jgi:zinc and cadmium transporter|uniref:ZIP family metal transporter n=1 Tax=Polynucleobacter sphagniphilus TaxID=1743169 RepID=UPI00096BCB56|nr:ZIP family metal transporter [Polynucleobacter sphagniphilus]MDF9788759.1 zinc and cadmium transporter [Polynucleobacter sphagniphilus]MDH6155358.1 zinc and cadmium transporter [Polynucleobacter sphagniphilus]MDH6249263.1 zinc and cadmium transporter [Polynucleobacter sphagniphilus]MDH6300236.1 zinc and cadmium transporter [Polynucleobacter sphagniphilus]MDH6421733.1 zinc and cadmium transporter [Polynucleobacter sphagniphilus]